MFFSQENQSFTCFSQDFVYDENEDYGFTLIESVLSELRCMVTDIYFVKPPTQINPNVHLSINEKSISKQNKASAFYSTDSMPTFSNYVDLESHIKKASTDNRHKSTQQSNKRFMKSKMVREDDSPVDAFKESNFTPSCDYNDYRLDSDTSMVIESSKTMLARTTKQFRSIKKNQTSFLSLNNSSNDKTKTTTCFNSLKAGTKQVPKPASTEKVTNNTSFAPSLATAPAKPFATPWDDCDEDGLDAPTKDVETESPEENRLVSSSGKDHYNFTPPPPAIALKKTPAVLHIGDDSIKDKKVRFNNRIEVRRISGDKCQDFTRVIEGKRKDQGLKRKRSWGAKRASKRSNGAKVGILKETGYSPEDHTTDEVIPLFSPDSELGRVALQLGIDLDNDDDGSQGEDYETEQVSCPFTIRCDLWNDDDYKKDWRPSSKSFANTSMKRFKVKVRRFMYGIKTCGKRLQSLMSLHALSSKAAGLANQSFVSLEQSEYEVSEEAGPMMIIAPSIRPMTTRC